MQQPPYGSFEFDEEGRKTRNCTKTQRSLSAPTADTFLKNSIDGPLCKEVDVAIIGNGPAGIFLSLLLSGYWPYFTGTHPNDYLRRKLNEHPNKSILEQDLSYLSDGLEGRSNNPVALLFDTLMRPNADIGEEHQPSLEWKYHPSRAIPHVVLGVENPGGSWHDMHPDIETLSLASWLDLPMLRFHEWKSESGHGERLLDKPSSKRARVGDVAQYFSDYVTKMKLDSNFISGVRVSQVAGRQLPYKTHGYPSPTSSVSSSSSHEETHDSFLDSRTESTTDTTTDTASSDEQEVKFEAESSFQDDSSDTECYSSDSDDTGVFCCAAAKKIGCRWCVRGMRASGKHGEARMVNIAAKKVVLACGVGGKPRRLKVPGEHAPFVKHRLSDFVSSLNELSQPENGEILVVGTGLTAADAILFALDKSIKVVHVFRQDPNDPSLIYRNLSPKMYEKYCHIYNLMQGKAIDSNYVPLSKHNVCEFNTEETTSTVVQDETGAKKILPISLAAVLIGSEAELGFLQQEIVTQLGIHPEEHIHHKHNPVAVDPISSECIDVPSLFALGPLIGDTFVRFVLGGALGAAQSLLETF